MLARFSLKTKLYRASSCTSMCKKYRDEEYLPNSKDPAKR